MSFTETVAVGRFVADPDMKAYTNSSGGGNLARFRLACDLGRDETAFYNCVAFGKTADVIQKYCTKGKQVLVSGNFRNSDYDKDVNGTTVRMYGMELTVNRLVLLGDAQQNRQQGQPNQSPQQGYGQQASAPQQGFQQQTQAAPQGGFGGFGQQAPAPQQAQQPQDPFASNGFGGFSSDDLPF